MLLVTLAFILLLAIGMPVAFAIGIAGLVFFFQHPELPSTTVALRLWETAGAAKGRPALKEPRSPAEKPKRTVACEGVVSVLTEVAKHLEAGRCLA